MLKISYRQYEICVEYLQLVSVSKVRLVSDFYQKIFHAFFRLLCLLLLLSVSHLFLMLFALSSTNKIINNNKKEGSTARPVPPPLFVVVVDAYRTIDNCATNNRVSVIRQHNFEYRRTACPSFCLAVFDFDCLRFGCKFCDLGPENSINLSEGSDKFLQLLGKTLFIKN